MTNSLRPIGGGDCFDRDGGSIDGLFVDAKVWVDRTTHLGRDRALGQGVVEDAPSTRVGPPTSEAGRIGKMFQGRDKSLAPPGAAEPCHRLHSRTALRGHAFTFFKGSLSTYVDQASLG